MNCETARQYLQLMLYGELSFDEEEALEQHLAACGACTAERARIERLNSVLIHGETEPPAGLLARCRRDLATCLGEESSVRRRFSPSALWRNWFVNPPLWLRPIGALTMLVLGFAGARLLPQPAMLSRWMGTADASPMVSRVRLVSADDAGTVRVAFDEVRQREVSGSLNDESIRRLLLAAASDPADPGIRVESMDLLKNQCNRDEVRQALLRALRTDPNSGVRLKALEGLKPYARDPDTRTVLAQVLLTDDNPGIRTQAIDMLVQTKDNEVAGVLQELLRHEDNNYVRSRSQRALRDMKASLGTF
jgi:hypothetical protein